jgi:adenylate cyclase
MRIEDSTESGLPGAVSQRDGTDPGQPVQGAATGRRPVWPRRFTGTSDELVVRPMSSGDRKPLTVAIVVLALSLPLFGLIFLLGSDYAQVHWNRPGLHFAFFLAVGGTAASLSLVAGEAARRRRDARVLLLSLAFLATSGFMALHAVGTKGVIADEERPGFTIAISAGLLLASLFALGAAFVDIRPTVGALVMRARGWLYGAVAGALAVWLVWSIAEWPPLQRPTAEGGNDTTLKAAAAIGAAVYAAAAIRLWWVQGYRRNPLVLSVVACNILLAEALVGVALAGEKKWHPAWWVWHALIVAAYVVVFVAAHREWRDERFRQLYLSTTREHAEEVSVLVGDLAGFTTFTEVHDDAEVTAMLRTYYEVAVLLITRKFRGEVESFVGDGIFATFNRRGDQPNHAREAVAAAAALQAEVARIRSEHPEWPGLRVGVNSGPVMVSEMGGSGYVAYQVVGDPVNVAARLQEEAPVGGVLIGESTRHRLPDDAAVVPRPGLRLKGKDTAVNAYLLQPT